MSENLYRRRRKSMSLREAYYASLNVKISRSTEWKRKPELASRQLPLSCPAIPRKVKRGMHSSRTLFTSYGNAKPIAVRVDGETPPLSPLYNKKQKQSYLDQLFDCRVKIGEGCFGYVYRAVCREDRKCYAIKYLKENAGTLASKEREILNYMKIGCCDYFVKFIRAWEEHERYYIQMEYCMMSLAAYASEHHYFPEEQLWDILVDMLLALKHLHGRNFIHLDIKPENIMISQQGIYKLGDFGLVVNLQELQSGKERVLNLSEGDSKYLATEVLEGVYTKACDIFSLGITVLELATDLVLPPNGALWHELRNGIFPEIFFLRVRSTMIKIIRHMMQPNHNQRPNVGGLLNFVAIDRIIKERKVKPRDNYLLNHSAAQEQVAALNGNNDIADHNMNDAADENANGISEADVVVYKPIEPPNAINNNNIEDDGVASLEPLENLSEYRYRIVTSALGRDENNAIASTSANTSYASPAAAVSPASSDPSTPPSASNRSIVFSPMRTRERRLREERSSGKSIKGRRLQMFRQ